MSNAVRALFFVCVSAIVLAIVLYFSVAQNRGFLAGWFGIDRPIVKNQDTNPASTKDAGISGAVSVNSNITVRPIDRNDHLWGPISAPVNLIIYDDFECPFCAQFYETVNRAKAEFGTNLVVAVRNFPLISHDQAMAAAEAAECASAQGKYWEMYHKLYEDNKAGRLKPETYMADAMALNLNEKKFSDCLTKESYKDKILQEKEEVKRLGVIGTPASFLNNQYIPGALPYDDFSYPDGKAALGLHSLIQQKFNEAK